MSQYKVLGSYGVFLHFIVMNPDYITWCEDRDREELRQSHWPARSRYRPHFPIQLNR